MNERNEQGERKVNVIKLEIEEVSGTGDLVLLPSYGDSIECLPIFTIIENETVPPLQSAMTNRAKQLLIDQGFTRNIGAEFGRNNQDEVWTKKINYAASQETVKLAKIVLHNQIQGMQSEIEALRYSANNAEHKLDVSKQANRHLLSKIKTATLWQRVKYLFGGKL